MRISATTLESFRLYMTGDWMPEADLIATIKGEFVPTHAVELGQAFGKVLEAPMAYRVPGGFRCGEFGFDDAVMVPALDVIDRRGQFEVKATRWYGPHEVVAKADHLRGARLSEFKTTCNSFDHDKYAASAQWRFMADIFEPQVVTYHVFCLFEATNGVIELRSIESFNLYPYAELHQDCCELLGEFVEYVKARQLDTYLDARQRDAVGVFA